MSVKHLPYTLKEVAKNVFLVTFRTAYDAAMVFCRVQEFYESQKYKGKFFRMDDYIRDYALKHGGIFTYPDEWRGFNVPSRIIDIVHDELKETRYDTINDYDVLFKGIVEEIRSKVNDATFYVIGTSGQKGDRSVVSHEIAHGLYTTKPSYKEAVRKLIKEMSPKVKAKMYKELKKLGYNKSVWDDEMNAYLATGLADTMRTKSVERERRKFKALLRTNK